jgi:hypothetical protein
MPPHAELSSVASALVDLTARVSKFATDLDRPESEDLAVDLFEVERSLLAASRRLTRVVARLD